MDRQSTKRIHDLRRQLASEIVRSLGPLSQHVIAPSFGIPQPRMSELNRAVVDRCSMEWLIRRIYRMGGRVEIRVALGDAGRKWQADRIAAQRAAAKACEERRE